MQFKKKISISSNLAKHLLLSSIFLSSGLEHANEVGIKLADNTQQVAINSVDENLAQQEKVRSRLNEITAAEKAAKRAQQGYYVERKSYGTGRETEPPRYVKQLNKTWLKRGP